MSDPQRSVLFFYLASISFLVGVFFYSFFNFGILFPAILLGVSVGSFFLLILKKQKAALIPLLVSAFLAIGLLRSLGISDINAVFVPYDKEKVSLVGVVSQDPDKRDISTHVVIEVEEINGTYVSGTLQATMDRTSTVSYGDKVYLRGKLQLPQTFKTQTGKDFDYPGYLRAKGIGAVMTYPSLRVITPAGLTFFGSLYSIKHALEHSIESTLPEPAAGLLEGILLGNRSALGDALYNIFIIAGLVHVVVLSGYNLTIVAEALMRVFSRFPQKVALSIGALGIILFALTVGADATVVRASIMTLIVIVGRALKRPSENMRALLFACALMVLQNPLILTHDPSFILSFLAAFGLMTFAPLFEKFLSRVTEKGGVRGVLAATLATQAFVFPALIFFTGRFSLVSLPANLLALPLIPPAMLFGFLSGVIGLIHPYLAFPVMIPAWGLLSGVIYIAKGAAVIPGASIVLPSLQSPYIFAFYIILVPLAIYAFNKGQTYTKNNERVRK